MIVDYLAVFDGCDTILDLGCGIGNFAELDPERIIGIDITDDEIEVARRKGVRIVKADITKSFPIKDASVGGVWCSHLIEHLYPDQVVALLHEIDRVLRPEGIAVVRSPLPHRSFWHHIGHIRPYPPSALKEFLSARGPDAIEFHPPDLTVEKVSYEFEYPSFVYRLYHRVRRRLSAGAPTASEQGDAASRLRFGAKLSWAARLFRLLAGLGIRRTGYTAILAKRSP